MIKSFLIYIPSSAKSVKSAKHAQKIAKEVGGIDIELWEGVSKYDSFNIALEKKLHYASVNKSYIGSGYIDCEIGAFLSHMSLWEKCIELNERIMIMEHDAMFSREFEDYEYDGILNLGKPNWGSRVWEELGKGVFERFDCKNEHYPHDPYNKKLFDKKHCQCDTKWLFGAHTYIINPRSAKILIEDAKENGIYAADIFIRTELVNIADQLPHNRSQVSDFSLIQKTYRTNLKSSNDAWK